MNATPSLLQRTRTGMIAFGMIAAAAAAASVLVLVQSGARLSDALLTALAPSFLLAAIGVASQFLCRTTPLRDVPTRLIATHVVSAAVATGLWIAAWHASAAVLAPALRLDSPSLIAIGVLIYFASVVVQYLIIEANAVRDAEQAVLQYEILAREAELRAFKAQVDPHFLFNSLNAVASLCGTNPQQAREMSQKLADFFRMMLRVGKLEKITLREELDLVSRYLDIEKVRFGPRLDVKMTIDDAAAECTVPPLLLQPLVENAVRHGIASVVDGGTLDVGATLTDGVLRIWIDNPADPDRDRVHGEGIGLQNARGRLQAAYRGAASFHAHETDGSFRVRIELPR